MTFSLLFLLHFQAKAYTVSTNTTWSSSQPTFSDITVENGAILTYYRVRNQYFCYRRHGCKTRMRANC